MRNSKSATANITYRTGQETDIPHILHIIKTSFEEYRGRLNPPSSAHHKTIEIVTAELHRATAIVAHQDKYLVGCVFYQVNPDYVYFDRLAVLPAWRRQGIAGQLIKLVEQRAIRAGKNRVRLSVRVSLADHHSYYQNRGYQFKSYGTHPGFDHPTFLVLEKFSGSQ